MITRQDLLSQFDLLLEPQHFRDYGPNGMQVEGKLHVHKIVSGVTASLALIEAAIVAKADAIFVHHGLFWRGHDGRVTGWMKQRLALLLAHDINLLAYHLPLDAHHELGNNAQLGKLLGLSGAACFGEQQLGWMGEQVPSNQEGPGFASAQLLADHVAQRMARDVVLVPGRDQPIRKIAWCTGGAQSYFESAIAAGADAFITGEISEPQAHIARETGVAFIACGHHASERYGAQAVASTVATANGLDHVFIDLHNPA